MGLQERLDRISEGAAEQMDAEDLEVMHRVTEELGERGLAERALGEGDRIPGFELDDQEGTRREAAVALRSGPLVLTFFRGTW